MTGRLSKGLDSGFTRENLKHPQSKEKALRRQINGFGGQNQQSEVVMYEGLPVRFGGIAEDKPYLPCVNPSNGRVKYLKRENGRNV